MDTSYYLQDIPAEAKKNQRHFVAPAEAELSNLKTGEMVRLFFVFNFSTNDGCRAERMWIEISEINGDQFKGYLTNQPVYIKELKIGVLRLIPRIADGSFFMEMKMKTI